MKSRALAICPSRERFDRCLNMYKSFKSTSSCTDIMICVDDCDPQLHQYEKNFNGVLVGKRSSITEIINDMFETFRDKYEYFHITNDDFIYHTPGWDQKFINVIEDYGPGIAYGNDLFMGKNLPTAPFISAEIVRALGWLQMPTLEHLCGDCVWKIIGDTMKRLYYVPDVIIEHRHFLKSHENIDPSYLRTNSEQMYRKDNESLRKWIRENAEIDIARIEKAIGIK